METGDIRGKLGHESLDTTSRYLKALSQVEKPQAALIAETLGIG